MVQIYKNEHIYPHDFKTVSLAYLNRYPNPYAKHVLSIDTLDTHVDNNGNLVITKLMVKTGPLPMFIKPFLGSNLNSWILEKTIINPQTKRLMTYSANIDHRKFIKVEEFLYYSEIDEYSTQLKSKVKFSSNLIGFKQRIEDWSKHRFASNIEKSRHGLTFVMNELKKQKVYWYEK
ncbi:Msf1-domain-containing protein [Yamadazyma tenuis]|uniref:MSF1-domain-containing protein n=1 Tax=Candida tenuis (strain ATCC 10573 / BCRC 21748 / CBS 615 / JCM 9827 / NBRC 10315 / NRRL Y-1498 / VKM Y-70) TaxID=590646 RepID=G3BBA3_CANTC|nr:MSF1-domain-containing protein [Yamadazyma tenuis ATCC 10573]EGV61529.1 MSF1-domain-containing protein [Yamadazyma tenuis ATCC 10573]WEJ92751.1 Msf1-domain-containing protein [Yamadazyma tenuis]